MDDIGVFTPEQARALWQDYQRRQQLAPHVSQNYPQRRPIDEVSPHRVFIKNTEVSETCPAYGCVQITGTEIVAGRTVVKVKRPTDLTGEYLFNSQFAIEAGATGWAYRFGVVVMLGDGTAPTAENVEYSPVVDSWTITEATGPFIVFGEHNAATDALVGKFAGGGSSGGFITFQPFEVVPGIGSVCDAVVATVLTAECGSSLSPGDQVNVWDRTRSWFAMPEDLLFASSGSAHYMQVSAEERYNLGDLDPGPCRWEVVSMNCIEDASAVY